MDTFSRDGFPPTKKTCFFMTRLSNWNILFLCVPYSLVRAWLLHEIHQGQDGSLGIVLEEEGSMLPLGWGRLSSAPGNEQHHGELKVWCCSSKEKNKAVLISRQWERSLWGSRMNKSQAEGSESQRERKEGGKKREGNKKCFSYCERNLPGPLSDTKNTVVVCFSSDHGGKHPK